jgi:1-acyl-sn-glycerol-3-phosphate acyltransferase
VNYRQDSANPFIELLKIWVRRTLSILFFTLIFVVLVALLPVFLSLAFIVDLIRGKSFVLSRCVLFFTFFFACEVMGILASFSLWLAHLVRRDQGKFLDGNFALQRRWANALAEGTKNLFNFHLEVEGTDELAEGPVIVFARHVSVADALLPAFFIANPNSLRLRYVLKRQLLWDPCLDIVGNRLPNVFVRRDAGEAGAVNRLMDNLTARDGVIIFPEGTRFTKTKQATILEKIKARGELRLFEQASRLKHTLPPRLGGALNLLSLNRQADVIFCAHAGFDGVVDLRDFLNGLLIGRTVKIKFWRVRFSEIPESREERIDWLLDSWKEIDNWVETQLNDPQATVVAKQN